MESEEIQKLSDTLTLAQWSLGKGTPSERQEAFGQAAAALLNAITTTDVHPADLFHAINRHVKRAAIEAVALRIAGDRVVVFLTKRPPDQDYPGQWHCPGTIFRHNEEMSAALARLTKEEFGVPVTLGNHVGNFMSDNQPGNRSIVCLVHLVELSGEPKTGQWYDVKCLPDNIVPMHRRIIRRAVKAFQQ